MKTQEQCFGLLDKSKKKKKDYFFPSLKYNNQKKFVPVKHVEKTTLNIHNIIQCNISLWTKFQIEDP